MLTVPVITLSDALVQGTILGSQEGVVIAFIISLWPRGARSPLRQASMTLAVEPNVKMNGGNYGRPEVGHQASLSTRPSFGAYFMFPTLGSLWRNLQGRVLSREAGLVTP